MAISGVTMTSSREKVIDFLHPHWEEPSGVIVRLDSNKWKFFIDAFSGHLWLAILLLPLFVVLVLTPMGVANDYIKCRLVRRRPVCRRCLWRRFGHCVFVAYGNLFLQGKICDIS